MGIFCCIGMGGLYILILGSFCRMRRGRGWSWRRVRPLNSTPTIFRLWMATNPHISNNSVNSSTSTIYTKFRGFQAARKHQDKILILVKMMYSSSGATMPCFEKGELAIKDLESRFNPPEIMNDLLLSEHCQKLINLSLDNWRTRWYDKWQYWAQGIFY